MRTVFIHGDVEHYTAAKTELTERFARWCAEKEIETPSALVAFVLEDRLVRDGLLARWTEQELERFLVEVVPRRLVLDGGWSVVPEFLHRWIDFLAESDLLMSGEVPRRALHDAIDRAVPDYVAAMAEPSEWAPAKFWSVTMAEHGVDVEDETAVERFFAAVDSGDVALDDDVVENIEDRDEVELLAQPAYWLPPMEIPDEPVQASDIADTPLLNHLHALHEWLGSGRKVTESNELAESELAELSATLDIDEFQVEVLLECARHARLVLVAGARLVPTQISRPLLDEPVLLWTRLWETFPLLDETFGDLGEVDLSVPGEDVFSELVLHALRLLYSQTDAISAELVVDMTAGALVEFADEELEQVPPATRVAIARMLRSLLDLWESMGVVRRFVTGSDEQIAVIDAAVPEGTTPEYTMLELMPCAVGVVRESLRMAGFMAPTVAEMPSYPAEVVVLTLPDTPPDVVKEVITSWIGARGEQAASAELARLLSRVDDPLIRLSALWLLEHTGSAGVRAVAGLSEDPIAGPAARMWLQSHDHSTEVPVLPGDELLFSLDGMAVTADEDATMFLTEFQQQPTIDQIAVVEEISRTRHVRADTVLEVIAQGHPDSRVVSVASRSLGKVRGG